MESLIEIHNRAINTRKQGIPKWKIAPEDKRGLVRFLDGLALGQVNKGVKISESRQCKYLDVLRTPLEFFGRSTSRLTVRDIERWEKALSGGQLKSRRAGGYAEATKVDMRRALRIYLRWKLGKAKANKLTDWLDTRMTTKTPDFLPESDIDRLYQACKTARERFLISVLFDSGARATEFHNVRLKDVQLPEGSREYVKLALREEFSKTKGRTISLFWKGSLGAVREYLAERLTQGIQRDDPVFDASYAAGRLFLRRLGKKVLEPV